MALSMSIFSSISSYSGLLQNEQESQGILRSAFFLMLRLKKGGFCSRQVSVWKRRCPLWVLSTLIGKYFFYQWIFADTTELCLKYVGIYCNLLAVSLKIAVLGWPKGACKLLMSESIPCLQWCKRSCSGRSWMEAEQPNLTFHLL